MTRVDFFPTASDWLTTEGPKTVAGRGMSLTVGYRFSVSQNPHDPIGQHAYFLVTFAKTKAVEQAGTKGVVP